MLSQLRAGHIDDSLLRETIQNNLQRNFSPYKSDDALNSVLRFGVMNHLPALLAQEDKQSMAWSVECRTVFTDYRLVDLLSTVPSAMKYSDGREKYLLRQVAKKYIPDYIIERKKLGFPELPDGKAELVHEMIEQKLLTKSPVLNRLFDQKLLQYPEQLSLNMQWKLCSVALLELALL